MLTYRIREYNKQADEGGKNYEILLSCEINKRNSEMRQNKKMTQEHVLAE